MKEKQKLLIYMFLILVSILNIGLYIIYQLDIPPKFKSEFLLSSVCITVVIGILIAKSIVSYSDKYFTSVSILSDLSIYSFLIFILCSYFYSNKIFLIFSLVIYYLSILFTVISAARRVYIREETDIGEKMNLNINIDKSLPKEMIRSKLYSKYDNNTLSPLNFNNNFVVYLWIGVLLVSIYFVYNKSNYIVTFIPLFIHTIQKRFTSTTLIDYTLSRLNPVNIFDVKDAADLLECKSTEIVKDSDLTKKELFQHSGNDAVLYTEEGLKKGKIVTLYAMREDERYILFEDENKNRYPYENIKNLDLLYIRK